VAILKWLDENFYTVIKAIIGVLIGFLDTLDRLAGFAPVVAAAFWALALPMRILLHIVGLLQLGFFVWLETMNAIVKAIEWIWNLLGTAPDWMTNFSDWMTDKLRISGKDLEDTAEALEVLANTPGAIKAGFDAAGNTIGDFRNILEQANATIDANIEKQGQMEQPGAGLPPPPPPPAVQPPSAPPVPANQWRIPPGWEPPIESEYEKNMRERGPLRRGRGTDAAGSFGSNTTTINFNGPDWDEVNSQWQAYYDKQKRAEADAYRTRGAGYSPA